MGPIDGGGWAHGWLPELVIKGNDTIPEYGGGLCQVSPTMFRAALYSGLEITARRNHSYAVSYYTPYGLDATIYDPWPDFKFKNDTPAHLLIQGYTEGSEAYFVFYGTQDDRSVEMEGPFVYNYHSASTPWIEYTNTLAPGERQLKAYAHTGFDVDWYRTVTYGDGTQGERENYHSSYEARPHSVLRRNSRRGHARGIITFPFLLHQSKPSHLCCKGHFQALCLKPLPLLQSAPSAGNTQPK